MMIQATEVLVKEIKESGGNTLALWLIGLEEYLGQELGEEVECTIKISMEGREIDIPAEVLTYGRLDASIDGLRKFGKGTE